jgi:diguanylate cyclase (GGDEF)-like protein
MAHAALGQSSVPARDGLHDPVERRAAGRMTGLLWMIGGVSGALWYLVPGAEMEYWQLGLACACSSTAVGLACFLAPWTRMSPAWIYVAAGLSLIVIPIVMALNGGADSPTVLYLFLASVLFGYYLPTGAAIAFLVVGVLVPATPMLYDAAAREPTFIARYILTAPIYAGVGLAVVLAKRQLVAWRNQAREQALRDPLTGLANRRALGGALREAAVNPRTPRPLALVMIDLDNFKLANTLYGHVGGDRVLCCAADVLRGATRRGDLAARLGGDEFAVFVCGASEEALATLAQRIVDAMRNAELPVTPPGYRLTASAGLAILDTAGGDVDGLLDAADRELRRAKSGGKDRWDAGDAVLPQPRVGVGA